MFLRVHETFLRTLSLLYCESPAYFNNFIITLHILFKIFKSIRHNFESLNLDTFTMSGGSNALESSDWYLISVIKAQRTLWEET